MRQKSQNLQKLSALMRMLQMSSSPKKKDEEFEHQFVEMIIHQHQEKNQGGILPEPLRFSAN